MHDSPRLRRLRNDLAALERLKAESSVFEFKAQGDPPHAYRIRFKGRGLHREGGRVRPQTMHEVEIKLGSSYPRTIPEIRWLSPIYHPNISEIGMVCLGGYGTHWVPSVQLDELCTMLWDMVRYHNFDVRSPYNRDAALWAGNQTAVPFPTDPRPIRDLREAMGRIEGTSGGPQRFATPVQARGLLGAAAAAGEAVDRVRRFLERRNRPADDEQAPTSLASMTQPLDDGVLILESTVDEAVAPIPPAPEPEADILFIE
ncbi:ubiquitin-conjugating enzyme E2 [Paludisphaera rhizosphaerae]|uniref:ubiquitin-conjugating enzyme E2 n=1 Tax=Paludisphaera rhizosphaerae TaxID=2711216 RepID=UPI0013EC9494|nr:ubiquitin-conjugating enzyme E2 [Paludisphaera rhizosphaerae]